MVLVSPKSKNCGLQMNICPRAIPPTSGDALSSESLQEAIRNNEPDVYCIFKNKLYLEKFQVSKIGGKVQRFPYNPRAPNMHNLLPPLSIFTPDTFVTIHEPTLCLHQPESTVDISVHCWCRTFYAFGQMYNDKYPPL